MGDKKNISIIDAWRIPARKKIGKRNAVGGVDPDRSHDTTPDGERIWKAGSRAPPTAEQAHLAAATSQSPWILLRMHRTARKSRKAFVDELTIGLQ